MAQGQKYHRSMTATERKQYDEQRAALLALYSALVTLDRQAKSINPYHVRRYYSRRERRERDIMAGQGE